MATRSSRTVHVITIPHAEVKAYAAVPKRKSRITSVEALRLGDNPIHAVRITIETDTNYRHRNSQGWWRR